MPDYRIIIADDHAILRDGLKQLIQMTPGLCVSGEAADGAALRKMIRREVPDLIILDIAMPGVDGIDIAREIRKRHPSVDILFLSMHKNRQYLKTAMAIGARGYLLKENTARELLDAIKTVRRGGTYLSPGLLKAFSSDIIEICRNDPSFREDPLTSRERQVLKLIAAGHTNLRIGELLGISGHTVHRHRANIRAKLHLTSTAELVRYAVEKELVPLNR